MTPDTKSDVANPVVFDEDISELGKTLDVLEDREEKNETENRDRVIIEEITQQKEGWRHEYYVVLGFFLVFTAVFLIIIAVLVYKLKKNKVRKVSYFQVTDLMQTSSDCDIGPL